MIKFELSCLVLVDFLSSICYSIVVPFLPLLMGKYGIEVSIYGYIFSLYALAIMVSSLVAGVSLAKFGRKQGLILGLFLLGVAMMGFGLLQYIPSNELKIWSVFLFRVIEGLSSGVIITASYSIIAILYPVNTQKVLGVLEISSGLGLVAGPSIGATLYTLLGLEGTFYAIGSLFCFWAIILYFIFPETLTTYSSNKLRDEIDSESLQKPDAENSSESLPKLGYKEALSQKLWLCSGLAAFFGYFAFWYMDPVLAIRLLELDLSEFSIGIFFWVYAVGNMWGTVIVNYVTERIDNKTLILLGMLIIGVSSFFIGPSIFLPDKLWIMVCGQFVLGVFTIFTQVTTLPEMIKSIVLKYPHRKYEANDLCSGLYSTMLGMGQMLSPLYGSYMTQAVGFRLCADIVAYLLIAYALIYFMLWIGLNSLKSNPKISKTEELNMDVPESCINHIKNDALKVYCPNESQLNSKYWVSKYTLVIWSPLGVC